MLGIDYRFSEYFSTGLTFGGAFSTSKPEIFSDGLKATWTNQLYYAALRPTVHITRVEDWDFYSGFSIGLHRSYVQGTSNASPGTLEELEGHLGIQPRRTTLAYTGFAGLRRSISHKVTVGGELGFGVSLLTVG
ncbi:MAG: hypothetical protein IPM82_20630 [Saprospiraceae bacterium]|nr:hypothetical protein [Saprospiraceae bacterium]